MVDPDEQASPLLPAALAVVPGRVSRRVGEVLAGNEEIFVADTFGELSENKPISSLVGESNNAFLDRLTQLEIAFSEVGDLTPHERWTLVPLTRSDRDSSANSYLCVLAPYNRKRNLVHASRRLVLSNASARFRARWLEKEREKLRAMRTSHGFYGPAEQLRSGLNMVCNDLAAGVPPETGSWLFDDISFLRQQAEAMCQLAKDAVKFVNVYDTRLQEETITTAALCQTLQTIVDANQTPKTRIIRLTIDMPEDIEIQYSQVLLRHGLAKLVDNAVYQAKSLQGAVEVSVFLDGRNIVLEMSNPVRHPALAQERIQSSVSGSLDSGQGLREAYTCFGDLLTYDIDFVRNNVRFRVSIPWSRGGAKHGNQSSRD
jgi:hypothetical protein